MGESHLSDIPDFEVWSKALETTLTQLEPMEIVEWNHIFDQLAKYAKTGDLMAACWLINGGAGDDGFYYFRCWLMGMGKNVYEAALINADSLTHDGVARRHTGSGENEKSPASPGAEWGCVVANYKLNYKLQGR